MNNSRLNLPCILALSLVVSGCELMGPELHKKIPLGKVEQINENEEPEVIYQELSNEASLVEDQDQPKVELYPGSGDYFSHKSSGKPIKGSEKGAYSLNFDDADLGEVTKVILTDILAENYVLSPKVTGRVTLQTTKPLTKAELIPTLEMLLQMNNAAMAYQNGIYQIKPTSEVIGSSAIATYNKYKGSRATGHQIRVVPVRNVAVDELAAIIKPLLQEKTILHVDSNRNMMLVAGTPAELSRAMEMVNTFDVDVMKGRSFGLFPLQKVEAAKVMEELEQIFNKDGTLDSRFIQFMQIERLNAILAITYQSKSLQEIERWIFRLDRANTSAGGGAIVYRVQHVDAVELAATLNEIFSQSGSDKSRAASIAAGRKRVEVTNKKREKGKKPKSALNQLTSVTAGISDLGEVKVIADEINNALIIVATAQDYAVVQQVIKQLDVMPLQVLIDATIVDVTLTDNLEYGIKWFFEHGNGGENAGNSGGIDLVSTATDLALAGATGGLSSAAGFGYGFVSNSGDIKAVLNAEATKNNINIISSPSLMVLNNQEATIQVGEERSLRTSESTNTSGGGDTGTVVTNTIEQRKTGVTVIVKPRVNANGLVIMEIEQSVEDFGDGATNGNPDILTREIKSSVAVQSGETIVLGGLISEKTTNGKEGIPLLQDIPLIGPLFGNTEKTKRKTELVVLITPRVVRSRQDARLVTNEFKRKLSGIYEDVVKVESDNQAVEEIEQQH
jgi:general secretion pathway protein D